jgi:hypothetical protein
MKPTHSRVCLECGGAARGKTVEPGAVDDFQTFLFTVACDLWQQLDSVDILEQESITT